MDIAIIIGGNIGIGLAVSRKLILLGFRVYAIANDFTKTPFAHRDFIPISISLNEPEKLKDAVEDILNKEDSIYIIINAPEKVLYSSFEAISQLDLLTELTQYLLNPILLTRLVIGRIRQFQGFIINIAHENPLSSISCVIEGGLSSFYTSLFEDYRNHGVNITDLIIQSTIDSPINCEMVANTVDHLIRFKGGNAVTKVLIRSQDREALRKFPQITPSIDEFREIQLPPKSNFPVEQEPILTEERKRPVRKSSSQKSVSMSRSKVSRETVVIQRERKMPKLDKTQESKEKHDSRKLSRGTEPKTLPKISRDTVIIPREKKLKESKPAKVQERVEKPKSVPTVRIRRGRTSTKKD